MIKFWNLSIYDIIINSYIKLIILNNLDVTCRMSNFIGDHNYIIAIDMNKNI